MTTNKVIEIQVGPDAASDIADVLCFMRGYLDGKGADYDCAWLRSSLDTLSLINKQIKEKLI